MIVTNPLGLAFTFSNDFALQSIAVDPIRISLNSPSAFCRPCANIYLRKRDGEASLARPGASTDSSLARGGASFERAYTPLLGPDSPSRYDISDGHLVARGSWDGLEYECLLLPAKTQLSWQWRVRVESRVDRALELDIVHVQDVGLRASSPGAVNEYYVSQYLERRLFEHSQYGTVVCCRQNMQESVGHPWLMLACSTRAVAASTDGLQFYGRTFRATGAPEALRADRLAGELSGESSIVAVQAEPFVLHSGESRTSAFVVSYLPDHPDASSEADLERLDELVSASALVTAPVARDSYAEPARSRVRRAQLLPAEELTQAELDELFGGERRHVEVADGTLLSFFTGRSPPSGGRAESGPRHVVLRAKELRVERPHGHIMQANIGYVPDERIMSTTAFACGVFNSHLTQGNTNFNTLLSVCTNPTTPALEGQRVLIGIDGLDGDEYLLGVPSAFEMGLNHCRWIYKLGTTCLEVCTWTAPRECRINFELKVLQGRPVRLLLTHQFDDLNGWTVVSGREREFVVRPRAGSTLAAKFPEAQFRLIVNSPESAYTAHAAEALQLESSSLPSEFFVLEVPETSAFCLSFVGEVLGATSAAHLADPDAQRRSDCDQAAAMARDLGRELTLTSHKEVDAIREILPWYGANALIHYLTPYGLEQFSGAAWGTRDVCQGPVELLLCQEKYEEAKQVLRIVFSQQDESGGWPQWWMFDSYRSVRADSAHGDVVYWCVLALCSYIEASGDFAFLDERLPYFQQAGSGAAAVAPVSEHVDRIIALVVRSFVPGTALVQFGGGDWNDSLQPVSKELAKRLISSWTVQMSYQALSEYREVCARNGNTVRADELETICATILSDFNRHLVKGGVVAGYGLVGPNQGIELLLHPDDTKTSVHYSLLPMNRGVISGLFSKEQAEQHLQTIERHLKGPDGARLMDRPLRYRGGPQSIFQRAESSTYFGREIGLMYVHEQLRYAETQACMGRPDAFLKALRQAIPVDYQAVVPQGDVRQANCYYSSSDVAFQSRYEADDRYHEVLAGRMPLKGGWRVYSSGPGIYVALTVSRLLGLRVEYGHLILDPVIARSLDGLHASLRFRGRPVTFVYRVTGPGFGPSSITVNGRALPFDREDNRYRQGGAVIQLERFTELLAADQNRVEIQT